MAALLAALMAAIQMSVVEGGDQTHPSNLMSELRFWAMTMALIVAIFMCGMSFGGWLTWKYLLPLKREAVVVTATVQTQAPIVLATDPVLVSSTALYVTRDGARFHARQDCSGLSRANDISTKTACRLCVS
jgi:hypothetical protein